MSGDEATITGFDYTGDYDTDDLYKATLAMEIPGEITFDGRQYTVTSLSDNFGSSVGTALTRSIYKLTIPGSIESIPSYFLSTSYPNIRYIELGEGIKSIGDEAFENTGLNYVRSPHEFEDREYEEYDDADYTIEDSHSGVVDYYEILLPDSGDLFFTIYVPFLTAEMVNRCIESEGVASGAFYVVYQSRSGSYASNAISTGDATVIATDVADGVLLSITVSEDLIADADANEYDYVRITWFDSDGYHLNAQFIFVDEFSEEEEEEPNPADEYPPHLTVVIPASVETIGDKAFQYAVEVIIAEGSNLRSIGFRAFYYAESFDIPAGVEYIDGGAFGPDTVVTVDGDNDHFTLDRDGNLIMDGVTVVGYFGGATDNYMVPEGITKVADEAFLDNTNITGVTISSGVDWGQFVFEGVSLESITFQSGVTAITDYLFALSDLSNISVLEIPNQIEEIGYKAFFYSGLNSVEFPNGTHITTIGQYAFDYNENLTTVTFGAHADGYECIIDEGAFYYCNNLEYVYIHDDFVLTSIGKAAFLKYSSRTQYAPSLIIWNDENGKSTTPGITIPREVESIGTDAFSRGSMTTSSNNDMHTPGGYTYRNGGLSLNVVSGADEFEISFEDGSVISSMGDYAFVIVGVTSIDLSNCTSLTEFNQDMFYNVYKSEGTTTIDLRGCTNLESVEIVASLIVTMYGSYEVYLPTGFYSIVIGDYRDRGDVVNIGNDDGEVVTVLGDSGELIIGSNTIAVNADIAHGATSFDVIGDNPYFYTDDGLLYYRSEGDEGYTLVAAAAETTNVTIDGSLDSDRIVVAIGDGAFKGTSLGSLTIEAGVEIGESILEGIDVGTIEITLDIGEGDPDDFYVDAASFADSSSNLVFYLTWEVYNLFGAELSGLGDVRIIERNGNYSALLPAGGTWVSVSTSEISDDGHLTVELSFDGGYTYHDVLVEVDGKEVVLEGTSFTVDLTAGVTADITVELRDRAEAGNTVTVTFDGNGGTSSGQESVTVELTKGLTLVDSDIPTFTRDSYTLVGWTLDGEDFDFDTPVDEDITLYAVWDSRGYAIIIGDDVAEVFVGPESVDGYYELQADETSVEITIDPYEGYQVFGVSYVMGGETYVAQYDDETGAYTISDIAGDVTLYFDYRYYSTSSGLIPIYHVGLPTTDELEDAVIVTHTANEMDTSGVIWTNTVSVPVIVDNVVYFRAGDTLYAMESDTGYILATADSEEPGAFYHYLGYGNGLIVDYETSNVYNLDLELQFTLSRAVSGVAYNDDDGYFYTYGSTVYRFSSDPDDANNGTMPVTSVGNFPYTPAGSNGPVIVDGYMYRIYTDGNTTGVMAMCIDDGSEDYGKATSCELPALYSYYLDDGWLTYYDGTLYLSGYSSGLFGAVANPDYDILTWVNVDGLDFDQSTIDFIEFEDYEGYSIKAWTTQLVIWNDRAYFKAGPVTFVFDVGVAEDGKTKELTYIDSVTSAAGHGGITIDVSHDDAVYIYSLAYTSSSITVVKDSLLDEEGTLSYVTVSLDPNYGSQAIRGDRDGRMIWYNDSCKLIIATTPDKNPFFFFIQDGDEGTWYQAYGATPAEALATLGDDIISLGEYGGLDTVYGNDADQSWAIYALTESEMAVYGWTDITDTFGDSAYDEIHYYVISNSGVPENGEVFTYIEDGEVMEYVFAENVGDRSIIGTTVSSTSITYTFVDADGEEIEDSAITGTLGDAVVGDFPETGSNPGHYAVWVDSYTGEIADALPETFDRSRTYALTWVKAEYEVSAELTDDTLSVSVSRVTEDATDLDDAYVLVIAEYGDSAVWTYVSVTLTEGTGAASISGIDTEGLTAISATLVSGDDDTSVDAFGRGTAEVGS